LAKERLDEVHCQIFIMDERAFNKEYNAYFYRSTEQYDVQYTRCRIADIREDPKTKDLILHYPDPENGSQIREDKFDMIVLSVGVQPPSGAEIVSSQLGFDLNQYV
jgi:heterodisulfide reductase subunit A